MRKIIIYISIAIFEICCVLLTLSQVLYKPLIYIPAILCILYSGGMAFLLSLKIVEDENKNELRKISEDAIRDETTGD